MIKINVKKRDDAMDADDDEAPFEESDFGAESDEVECQNSECAGIKEEYEKMMVETIRIRVFLCFYCDFEDSDKSDMRRHFKATHHMKLSTADPLEQDCLHSIDTTINKMRSCYVHLEKEPMIESQKQEVISGEEGEQDNVGDANGGDDEYDYYPEDSYYEGAGSPEPSPAKKRKTESSESPNSPEDDDTEEEPRRSGSSRLCSDSKCPNLPIFKKRNRRRSKTWGTSMMKYLREELEGGIEDRPADSETVRKAKKQLRLLEKHAGLNWDAKPELTKRCNVCNKAPKRNSHAKANLILHIAKQHLNYSTQVYQCNQCESSFGSLMTLDGHINSVHLKEQPYRCPFGEGCRYSAHSVSNIDSHALYTHHIPRERIRASPETVELRKQLAVRMKGFRPTRGVRKESGIRSIRQLNPGERIENYARNIEMAGGYGGGGKHRLRVCPLCLNHVSSRRDDTLKHLRVKKHMEDLTQLGLQPEEIEEMPEANHPCHPRNGWLRRPVLVKEFTAHPCTYGQGCEKEFNSPYSLENHINKEHLDKLPYLCHLCPDGTAFYDRLSKKVHLHLSHAVPYTHPPGGPIAIDSYKKALAADDGTPRTKLYRCKRCDINFQSSVTMKRHFKEVCGKVYEVQCEDCEYVAPNKLHYDNHRRKLHADASKNKINEIGDDLPESLTEDSIGPVASKPSEKLLNMRGISLVKIEKSEHETLEKDEENELSIPSPASVSQDFSPSDGSADEDWVEDGIGIQERTVSASSQIPHTPERLTEEDIGPVISKPSEKLLNMRGISLVKLEESRDESPEGGEEREPSTHSPASVGEDYVPSEDSADEDWAEDVKRARTVSATAGHRKPGRSGFANVNRYVNPTKPKIVCGVCNLGCKNSEELKSHVLSEHMNKGGGPRKPGRKAKAVEEPTGGICDSCGKFEKDLKRHMEAEHSGAKKCHRCPFEIMDQNKLNLHYLQCHSDLTEKCSQSDCNYSSPVPAHMLHHKSNTHGEEDSPQAKKKAKMKSSKDYWQKKGTIVCEQCGAKWNSNSDLAVHVDKMHTKRECPEKGCGYSTMVVSELSKHERTAHRAQCGICGFVVGKIKGKWISLADHKCEDFLDNREQFRHNQLWSCPECPFTCKVKINLRTHREQQHGLPKEQTCNECGVLFDSRAALFQHVAEVHKGRKPMYCEVPGCDFVTYGDRAGKWKRRHMREGLHGKRGKRKPVPEPDNVAPVNI